MTAAEFTNSLMRWIDKNDFSVDVKNVECHMFSGYNLETQTIYIGTERIDGPDKWFEEFLEEHGFGWEGVPSPVLQFLHELGHSQTKNQFSDVQLMLCDLSKQMIDSMEDNKQSAIEYWTIPDELAANEWLISFANSKIDAISELCQFFIDHWEESIADMEEEAWNNYALDAI